jgi:predicted O-methyltransferase YrrM
MNLNNKKIAMFEEVIKNKYFAGIEFSDQRELNVFFSYLRGFSLLFLDSSIKNILEIGGGQSTSLLCKFGQRLGWNIITIDMNPDSITLKLRNQMETQDTINNISFRKGVSISTDEISKFYKNGFEKIGNISFEKAVKSTTDFIETTMDPRRLEKVQEVLNMERFEKSALIAKILSDKTILPELIKVYRTEGDELSFHENNNIEQFDPLLKTIMDDEEIDVVFLDSGEFSSIPEWEIVDPRIRIGGYVVLHDIYFPKSFKNWLVAGSIVANSDYNVLFIDDTTPQGLMIAQKIK